MLYFSGLSDALRMTFVQIMIFSAIALVIFLYGLITDFQKWGTGVTGYALEPQEGKKGSAITFLKTWWKQVTAKPHNGHGKPILEILILDILFQRRILKRSPIRWIMHLCIFGGWMTLFALSGLMFSVEMIEKIGIELPFTPAEFRDMLAIPNYIFGYILLIGLLIAIVRRLFVSEVREASIMYDWVLLGVIFIVTISGFLADGIRTGFIWSFGLDPSVAPPAALFHSIFSLIFCIACIPYTKYIHAIAMPLALLANKGGE
ncbi:MULTISPECIES: dihydromethanophenazine:CoB--CoM heterodisulfide reductase subunit HdrE [unclassified Methanosarcina]|jgi:heterodisulfide reductase subunit E|uniref:dihydromethanophenazine:CoB--CoM heterodisulfide reductase subunit HdrE n=1 Tax=unclassified Methanosarcina TaxID=2644672 RepID=UPI0026007B04|nr:MULTISPECIES: dihydromethanophenazine:CoB--CoM heterodisulfide reductase subunit HdrE [unclassified Methanosarcina]